MIPPLLAPPLLALIVGLGVSLLLTPVVRRVAIRFGYVNKPAADRWADRPTALLGGVGIVASTVIASALVLLVSDAPEETAANLSANSLVVGIFASAGLMFVVGILDDVVNLKPNVKFIAQVVAGAILVMFGGVIPLTAWLPVNVLLSVFWFVAITNALNLLDNMDGVAAGVAAIAAFFLGVSSLGEASWLVASLAWGLTGACLGFLRYNFKPATIFMGDAGSLFIGAVLAGVAATATRGSGSVVSVLFVPLVIVAVPILDTVLVTVTRAIAGRAFYQGGRDHTSHRLVSVGLSEHQTAWLLYSFALVGGLISLWLTRLDGIAAVAIGSVFLTILALIAAYLGHLRVEYTNEPLGSRTVTVLVTNLLYKRRLAEIVLDAVLCGVALIVAVLLRFDASPPAEYVLALGRTLPMAIIIQLVALGVFGVYRGRWRYVGLPEVHRIAFALLVSLGILLVYVEWIIPPFAAAPGIVYTNTLCAGALILSARFSFRSLRLFQNVLGVSGEPVIVYGGGDAGELALREMLNNPQLALTPVCILDDDTHKHRARIHGVEVVGGIDRAGWAITYYQARKILITTKKLKPEVLDRLRALASVTDVNLAELHLAFRDLEESTHGEVRALRLVGGGSAEPDS